MSNTGEMQPLLIQYARFHGLADDHLNEDIRGYLPLDSLPCDEDTTLPEFKMPCLEKLPLEPKYQLDSKAASLLASSLRPPPAPHWSAMLSDHRQVKNLKIEQPVLKSDHERDMRKVRYRKPQRIKPINLEPIEVAEDEDESLAWSLLRSKIAASWDRKLAEEKLQTTQVVLKALQDTLRPVYTTHMHEAIIAEDLALVKRRWVEPLSRELFSFELDQETYLPSLLTSRTQLLSEARDPDDDQPHQLNEDISKQCSIISHNVSMKQEQHPKVVVEFEPPGIEPLDLTNARQKLNAKMVTSTSASENLLSENVECEEPGRDETYQPFKNQRFARATNQVAQKVEDDLARENLEHAHKVARVEVPKLDDGKPAAPIGAIFPTEFLHEITEDHLVQTVGTFDEENEREMKWEPIPSAIQRQVIEEAIEPPPRLNEWISQPAFATKSTDLLWRPDVLRILRVNEESDEELEENFSLKDEVARKSKPSFKRPAPQDLAQSLRTRRPHQLSIPKADLACSGFGSLTGFMDTRKASKKPRLEPGEEQSGLVRRDTAPTTTPESKSLDEIQVPATPTVTSTMDMTVQCAPRVPQITLPRTIIISSRLLKSYRRLTQALETRPDPPLIIVYRDLDCATDISAKPDIIIAPTVAAILTSLQTTTQRSLPGQGHSQPSIFNRILRLSQVYEHLLVITTLPSANISPLSLPVTCSEISTLTSFCASVSDPRSDSIVQTVLVPATAPPSIIPPTEITHEPPDPLYTWTHALILRHALSPISTSPSQHPHNPILLAEETLWELFLCRAGMNPYAAQMVLGMLKKPENTTGTHHPDDIQQQPGDEKGNLWGLRAFVQRSREKRVCMFGSVVGTRAIERVSDVLDMAWGGNSR